MSEDLYYVNKTKKEYIRAYGNSNRSDSLRYNFPILLVSLLGNEWQNDEIVCEGDSGDLKLMFESKDRTNYYIKLFNKNGRYEEHGKLCLNKYAKDYKEENGKEEN